MNRTSGHRTVVATGLTVTVAIAVVVALVGCAPGTSLKSTVSSRHAVTVPHATGSPKPATGPASPPAPAAPGPLPANALFRITATATASDGAVADLVQTVFQPAAPTATDTALMNSECNYPGVPDLQGTPDWQTKYPSPLFVDTTMTATLHPGTASWSTDDSVLFDYLEGASAYSGAFTTFEAYCSPGMLTIPGTVHGVSPVPSASPAGGSLGWAGAVGSYGFLGGGNLPSNDDLGGTAVIANCSIELSAAARAAGAAIVAWATQPYVTANGCTYLAPGAS